MKRDAFTSQNIVCSWFPNIYEIRNFLHCLAYKQTNVTDLHYLITRWT